MRTGSGTSTGRGVGTGTGSLGTSSQGSGSTSSGSHSAQRDEQVEFPTQDVYSARRKPKWLRDTLKEAQESVGNEKETVRESRRPEIFFSYVAMVSSIKPSSYEEAAGRQVWRDAMVEDYSYIMKNVLFQPN